MIKKVIYNINLFSFYFSYISFYSTIIIWTWK